MSQFRTRAFPFCPVSGTTGSGTLHPIIVPITKVAEWYWRVKLWSITVNAVWGSITQTFQFGGPGADVATDEIELAECPPDETPIQFQASFTGFAGDEPAGTISGDIFLLAEHGEPAEQPIFDTDSLHLVTDAYWPQLMINISTSKELYDNVSSSSAANGSLADLSAASCYFDGYSVPLYFNDTTMGDDIIDAYIDPVEWWPYARESDSGGATYDTATGAVISADYRIVTP